MRLRVADLNLEERLGRSVHLIELAEGKEPEWSCQDQVSSKEARGHSVIGVESTCGDVFLRTSEEGACPSKQTAYNQGSARGRSSSGWPASGKLEEGTSTRTVWARVPGTRVMSPLKARAKGEGWL